MAIPKIKLPDNDNLQRLVNIIIGMFATEDTKITQTLSDAKDYTNQKVSEINVADALIVDELPIYDASGSTPVIKYKQGGVEKTTENMKTWFFYHNAVDDKEYQTIFINGTELTIKVANDIDFSDYVKVLDVVSTYTGIEVDKTKIPNLASLDALKGLIDLALADKVNSADIVDNLLSTDATKPLSANQGNQLSLSKLDNTTDATNEGKVVVVDASGNLVFGDSDNANYVTKAAYDALPSSKLTDGNQYWIN